MGVHFVPMFLHFVGPESGNFVKDLNVRFVDLFGLWDPFGLNFLLENFLLWFNILGVVLDISLNFITEILVSLSSSSVVVGNLLRFLELESGWTFSASWGIFGVCNLVRPGSGVHVANSLTGSFPLSIISFELISGIVGVFHVGFKILFDLPFEFLSLVNVVINLFSDFHVESLIGIRNHRLWSWFHGLNETFNRLLETLECFWPGGFSGGFESSFFGSDGFLVVNIFGFELLIVHDIVSLGISPFIDDLIFVVNVKGQFTIFVININVLHFVVKGSFVLLVDCFLLFNEGLDIILPSISLDSSIVVEINNIIDDGFIEVISSVSHVVETVFDLSSGSKRVVVVEVFSESVP
jgi:hypothetical protein